MRFLLLLALLSGLGHGQCITNVAAVPSATGAQVTWDTCSPTTSQVSYGLTTSYGTKTPLDSTLVSHHSVALANLTSSTLYHFVVLSHNSTNSYTSKDKTFTTLSGQPPPPHKVDLTWNPSTSTNVVGYNAYRSNTSGSGYV